MAISLLAPEIDLKRLGFRMPEDPPARVVSTKNRADLPHVRDFQERQMEYLATVVEIKWLHGRAESGTGGHFR